MNASWMMVVGAVLLAIEPGTRWHGLVEDRSLMEQAPKSGVITGVDAWEELWKSWRPDEAGEVPEIDFERQFVLVGTVPGPNRASIRVTGGQDLKTVVIGTRIGGPGFGYEFLVHSRDGVKTVNGKPLPETKPKPPNDAEDSITVRVVGTLKTGVVAIGAETTGTTITAGNITWELELPEEGISEASLDALNGERVIVTGKLERRRGVEISERWVVKVDEIEAVR